MKKYYAKVVGNNSNVQVIISCSNIKNVHIDLLQPEMFNLKLNKTKPVYFTQVINI